MLTLDVIKKNLVFIDKSILLYDELGNQGLVLGDPRCALTSVNSREMLSFTSWGFDILHSMNSSP